MTTQEPEELPEPGTDGPSPAAGEPTSAAARRAQLPSDVDAAFAAIVADWAADDAPRWPDGSIKEPDAAPPDPRTEDDSDDTPSSGVGTVGPEAPGAPETWRAPAGPSGTNIPDTLDSLPDDDPPYVPPEPPPLPRLSPSSLAGIFLMIVGVVLLALPGLTGGTTALGFVPGLLAMTAGLGWLVFGVKRSRDDDDSDDGAVP